MRSLSSFGGEAFGVWLRPSELSCALASFCTQAPPVEMTAEFVIRRYLDSSCRALDAEKGGTWPAEFLTVCMSTFLMALDDVHLRVTGGTWVILLRLLRLLRIARTRKLIEKMRTSTSSRDRTPTGVVVGRLPVDESVDHLTAVGRSVDELTRA